MARANEFLFFFDPGNSTAKVCANCRQDDQFAFGIFADVNGLFCDRLAPAVTLLDGDQLLYRRINVLKFVNASNVRPCLFGGTSQYRMQSKTHQRDRKSTRLNSSHVAISYAVFCLKKQNNI